MHGRWPFAGRSEPLARLRAVLTRGGAGGIVVAGPAGVGKTRLVVEALAGVDARCAAVLQASAAAATSPLPFGAFAHLLPGEMLGRSAAPASVHVLADGLLAPARGRRTVLAVDDVHQLDPFSAGLLHHLVRERSVVALLTLRSGEPAPEPVSALWTQALVDRIELAPLADPEVEEVLAAALGGPVDRGTARRLYQLSEGNVLLLRELVLAAQTGGVLGRPGGTWTLTGPLPVTARLGDLVDARIGHLPPDELEVLELVSFGEPIGIDLLTGLTSDVAVESAEARHLIRVTLNGQRLQARLGHPLFGELVRARCPTLRKRRRLGQLADAVEKSGAVRREDILRVATWRLDSGTPAPPELLATAAALARAAHDMSLAIRIGQAALDAGAGVLAAVTVADALVYTDSPERAEEVLAGLVGHEMTESERAVLAAARANILAFLPERRPEAHRILDEAEAGLHDPVACQRLGAIRINLHVAGGDLSRALAEARRILDAPGPDLEAAATAAALATAVLALRGAVAEAQRLATVWLDRAEDWRTSFPIVEALLHLARCMALAIAGRPAAAHDAAVTALALAERGNWQMGTAYFEMLAGFALRLCGDATAARRACTRAVEINPPGRAVFGPAFSGELAHCAALCGDPAAARSALQLAEGHRCDAVRMAEYHIDLAAAPVAAAEGDLDRAVDLAVETAARARAGAAFAIEMLALHDAVRFGGADRVVCRLRELGTQVEGQLAPVIAAHAAAAVEADTRALEAASAAFASIGTLLYAAEAAAQAAQAHRDGGRAGRARAAEARAFALAQRCPGARTPALIGLRTPGLTPRERQIAGLAADGLTSRQIAERLTMSVRTVDNHLRSAYGKLGVAGRAELAAALGR